MFLNTEDLIQYFHYTGVHQIGESLQMPFDISNKPQLTGITVLFIGVALLAFTFINAFLFLQEPVGIIASGDLARVFGEALAPLIQACIRLIYLGIMGWIGSLLTIRGLPLVTHKYPPPIAKAPLQTRTQAKPSSLPQTPQTSKPPTTQPKPESPQPQTPQTSKPQLVPEPRKEEPRAILIPPENQRED